MRDLQRKIDGMIEAFVAAVVAVAAAAAADELTRALDAGDEAVQVWVEDGRARAPGGKRTRAELDATRARARAFIAANPGLRIEQINARLGTTTGELALPLRQLIREGAIRTEGTRRATTYFATG